MQVVVERVEVFERGTLVVSYRQQETLVEAEITHDGGECLRQLGSLDALRLLLAKHHGLSADRASRVCAFGTDLSTRLRVAAAIADACAWAGGIPQ